jgi:thiol-disulfide isomerase/thioredoxin
MGIKTLLRAATVVGVQWSAYLGAQTPAVGDEAPSFEAAGWLNIAKGAPEPSNRGLLGRVVMLEFWGTWCGPCVRAMPIVQGLHEKYGARGLTVLAVSYEAVDVLKPFVEKNGYAFAVGSDPAKRVVEAYGVSSWPTTFVVGKDGKVAFVGSPHGAETAIEAALGLATEPSALLTAALDALAAKDKAKTRDALGRVAEKEETPLDLRAWAVAAGGVAAEAAAAPKDFDAAATLERLAKARAAKDAPKTKAALDLLATHAPTEFDASPWARRAFGREFPLAKKELGELLAAQRFGAAVDALCLRAPAADAVAAAAADKRLREYAGRGAAAAREEGRKALMIAAFVLERREPKDNDAFWRELAVSGMRTSEDRKSVVGVLLGEGCVTKANAAFFADLRFARAFVMESLAAGKEPKTGAALQALVDKEREKTAAAVEKKHGGGP